MVGLSDTIVVETADAVLVADKSRVQDLKHIVNQLKKRKSARNGVSHGHASATGIEGIARGPRYQVKRIVVRPGRNLSLKKHHHRAEH